MASAVLASQNESSCAPMGKIPYSNHHLNGNPNPKKKQKQFHHAAANGVVGRYHNTNVDSPAVTQTASDDAYSFNQTSTSRNAANYGSYLTFNVASYTKSELLHLRKRLSAELDRVRDLCDRIDSGQFNALQNPRSEAKSKKFIGNRKPIPPLRSVPEKFSNGNANGSLDAVNSEVLLKECSKIVAKLIKHKFGYVFKTPVDAVGLGLHDYHLIVKRPMDLGTVKSNLAKKLYPTPVEFAADVRLTFNNALLYNPKNDPFNGMAEQMLARFEELFRPIQEKLDISLNNDLQFRGVEELQGSSWSNHSNQILNSPVRSKTVKQDSSPVPVDLVMKSSDRIQTPKPAHSSAATPLNSLPTQPAMGDHLPFPASPVRAPSLTAAKEQKIGRSGTMRQPKPRAKDVNKRDMSMEEKQKLGLDLQSLPQEKMPQLVNIIRKRNDHLAQDGDEIELDIEALDTETLWELDRFVTNWKKMVSKTRRQALMMNNKPGAGVSIPTSPVTEGAMNCKNGELGVKLRENEDEDVDIDDDMPATSFPPVEIEKDEGIGGDGGGGEDGGGNSSSSSSSSGSSSSDSSSSNDSDSGSSSGSDSDADDAQS